MGEPRDIRIFISSPGDVRPERLIAERVIGALAREFADHFRIEPVLWEREPLVATEHFQTMITPPSETDIAVVILWSRLGTPLPKDEFRGAISGEQVTGTEWEFEDAVAANREDGRPDLLLYRKQAPVMASLEDDAALEQMREQKRRVERFMQRWFVDAETETFKAASHVFESADRFEEMLETHLRALLRRRLDPPEEAEIEAGIRWHAGSPFRGLESFEIEHAPVFFGRTRARNEVRDALAKQAAAGSAFVLVFGASGSGKSSLVKAGLLPDILAAPRMVEAAVGLCRHAVFRPGEGEGEPLDALAAALLREGALPELGMLQYDAAAIAELMRDAPSQAALPIRQALAKAGAAAELVAHGEARLTLVVDQLEEVFTAEAVTAEARERFVAALAALARSGLVWVVCTLRSDFFERLEGAPALAALSEGHGRYLLMPPVDAEIGQIVRRPAREAGLRFEVDEGRGLTLDEVIRAAAARDPAALPLLQYTLDQLWQRRDVDSGRLTFAAYEALGGLEGALGRRAEEVFSGLPEDAKGAFPGVIRALVTVAQGEGAEATARTAPLSTFPDGTPARRLVDAFIAADARLLVAEGDGDGARVRVAHEALLTHWPRARRRIEEDRHDLQVRARLELAAAQRQAAAPEDRHSLLLNPGLPLSEAEDLLARRRDELDSTLVAYVGASTAAARTFERRRVRRLQRVAAVLALAAVVPASAPGSATRASGRRSGTWRSPSRRPRRRSAA